MNRPRTRLALVTVGLILLVDLSVVVTTILHWPVAPRSPSPIATPNPPIASTRQPTAPPPVKRLPVPSDAVCQAHRDRLRQWWDEYNSVRWGYPIDPWSRWRYAEEQLEKLHGDELYACLREMSERSADSGELQMAWFAVRHLRRHFVVDGPRESATILVRALQSDKCEKYQRYWSVSYASEVYLEAILQSDFAVAEMASGLLVRESPRLDYWPRAPETLHLDRPTLELLHVATTELARRPDDPAANELAGSILAWVCDKPWHGTALLTRSADAELAEAARLQHTNPADGPTRLRLASQWAKLSERDEVAFDATRNRAVRAGMRGLASGWYGKAKPLLPENDWPAVDERLRQLGRQKFTGHAGSVWSVAFSPDGKRVVSGGGDAAKPGEIHIWDVRTSRQVRSLEGHERGVNRVVFSPDGQHIASASEDGTIRLWDADSRQTIHTLKGHSDGVLSVEFSADGRWLVSGSWDHTIKVWDARSGRNLWTMRGHTSAVTSAAISPDGSRIVSASLDGDLRTWSVQTVGCTAVVDTYWGRSVAFSSDGKHLVFDSGDVRDSHTNEKTCELEDVGRGGLWSVAFSPDCRRIVGAQEDGTVGVWDAESGRRILKLRGHAGSVLSAAFSPDGQRIVSGSVDRSVRVWGIP